MSSPLVIDPVTQPRCMQELTTMVSSRAQTAAASWTAANTGLIADDIPPSHPGNRSRRTPIRCTQGHSRQVYSKARTAPPIGARPALVCPDALITMLELTANTATLYAGTLNTRCVQKYRWRWKLECSQYRFV